MLALVLRPLLLVLVSASNTASTECKDAARRYEAAVAEINEALPAYQKCVAASGGRDDCEGEFGKVDVAQDAFQTVVEEYRRSCAMDRR